MAKYKYLLFDIDNTILSFDKAEWDALSGLFQDYGFGDFTKERLKTYHSINHRSWGEIEGGRIEKNVALVQRFVEFFEKEGLDVSKAEEFNVNYQLALGDTIAFCENSFELLMELKKDYVLLAVTNGTKLTQDKKLRVSKLEGVFDFVFISEEVGYEKPDIRFFDYVRKRVGLEDFDDCLLIGDSLSSDIKGANNAKIRSVWYNPKGEENITDAMPDMEIKYLDEIKKYLN